MFCSPFNAGAAEVVDELIASGIDCVNCASDLNACDRMLVLLDARTWTSREETKRLGEQIEEAFRLGIPICCAHELPSLLSSLMGPPRHPLEFRLVIDTTPAHLSGRDGTANLYREIAVALLGDEWRRPGLTALATKLMAPIGQRQPQACELKMASWWAAEQARSVEAAQSTSVTNAVVPTPSPTIEDLQRALAQLPPEQRQRQIEQMLRQLHP